MSMASLRLEQALSEISTGSLINSPFYGTAGAWEQLLKTYTKDHDILSDQLAKMILNYGREHKNKKSSFMTVEEYAKIMKRAPYTIRRWIKQGKVPSARKIGNNWFIY